MTRHGSYRSATMTTVKTTLPKSEPKDHHDLVKLAGGVIKSVVNQVGFRTAVIARPFSTCNFDGGNGATPFPTNAEIADIVKAGIERGTVADRRITIPIELVNDMSSKELGEVNLPNPTVFISRKFFEKCLAANDATALASVLMHEWMHLAGFDHDGSGSKNDVPYELGFIVLERAATKAKFIPGIRGLAKPRTPALRTLVRNWDCPIVRQSHGAVTRPKDGLTAPTLALITHTKPIRPSKTISSVRSTRGIEETPPR